MCRSGAGLDLVEKRKEQDAEDGKKQGLEEEALREIATIVGLGLLR